MTIDDFLSRWTNLEGGAERANYQLFLTELCDVLEVARPQPAGATHLYNDYVFERAVRPRDSADIHAPKRIDLYKKGCFILEAKQSRLAGARNDLLKQGGSQTSLPLDEPEKLGKRGTGAKWDAMMRSARQQGERYVFLLDKSQPAPPFLIVCDVGHCLELYADFSGTGRDYTHFPTATASASTSTTYASQSCAGGSRPSGRTRSRSIPPGTRRASRARSPSASPRSARRLRPRAPMPRTSRIS